METLRETYRFAVKEYSSGQPFIALEGLSGTLPILDRYVLSFDLQPGTTYEAADNFARLLRDRIVSVAATGPLSPQ